MLLKKIRRKGILPANGGHRARGPASGLAGQALVIGQAFHGIGFGLFIQFFRQLRAYFLERREPDFAQEEVAEAARRFLGG